MSKWSLMCIRVCVLGSDGSGTCGGDKLSKNCIEIDPTDNNKCKKCYNLKLNANKQCCPENCLDCDRDGNCKDGQCKSGYYLDNNECKTGKSRSQLNSDIQSKDTQISSLQTDIQSKDTQISTQNTQISGLQTDIQNKSTQISGLQTDIQSKNTQISGLQTDIQNKSTQISGLQTDIQSKNTQISGLQTDIQSKTLKYQH